MWITKYPQEPVNPNTLGPWGENCCELSIRQTQLYLYTYIIIIMDLVLCNMCWNKKLG